MLDQYPLPPGFRVEAMGKGEERRVLLDIEGTTFELHPEDAKRVGEALSRTAAKAESNEGES